MYISRRLILVSLFIAGKLSGLILVKSREEFVQPNQFNSGVSEHKEIKSNTRLDSGYTQNHP
jgi:hypothetical protein